MMVSLQAPDLELNLHNLLETGREMPTIAFGTWKMGNGDGTIGQVDQAISVGFSHIGKLPLLKSVVILRKTVADTAQSYRNEEEAGSCTSCGAPATTSHYPQ